MNTCTHAHIYTYTSATHKMAISVLQADLSLDSLVFLLEAPQQQVRVRQHRRVAHDGDLQRVVGGEHRHTHPHAVAEGHVEEDALDATHDGREEEGGKLGRARHVRYGAGHAFEQLPDKKSAQPRGHGKQHPLHHKRHSLNHRQIPKRPQVRRPPQQGLTVEEAMQPHRHGPRPVGRRVARTGRDVEQVAGPLVADGRRGAGARILGHADAQLAHHRRMRRVPDDGHGFLLVVGEGGAAAAIAIIGVVCRFCGCGWRSGWCGGWEGDCGGVCGDGVFLVECDGGGES
mmetsp:Transcript_28865/g.83378  ORF Transcript_28865/g.83378 Transcript_28865/m.83378 type:complete len:287 (-) Transcript_28865:40-900(-)